MRKILFSVIALFLFAHQLTAQAKTLTITINGKVTSFEESLPLEGVRIQVKGATNITGTQSDGTFTLAVSPGDVLQLSLAGYEKKEIVLSKSTQYDIVLKRSSGIVYAARLPAVIIPAVPAGPAADNR